MDIWVIGGLFIWLIDALFIFWLINPSTGSSIGSFFIFIYQKTTTTAATTTTTTNLTHICPEILFNTKYPVAKSLPVLAKGGLFRKTTGGNTPPPLLCLKKVPLQRSVSTGCQNYTQLKQTMPKLHTAKTDCAKIAHAKTD